MTLTHLLQRTPNKIRTVLAATTMSLSLAACGGSPLGLEEEVYEPPVIEQPDTTSTPDTPADSTDVNPPDIPQDTTDINPPDTPSDTTDTNPPDVPTDTTTYKTLDLQLNLYLAQSPNTEATLSLAGRKDTLLAPDSQGRITIDLPAGNYVAHLDDTDNTELHRLKLGEKNYLVDDVNNRGIIINLNENFSSTFETVDNKETLEKMSEQYGNYLVVHDPDKKVKYVFMPAGDCPDGYRPSHGKYCDISNKPPGLGHTQKGIDFANQYLAAKQALTHNNIVDSPYDIEMVFNPSNWEDYVETWDDQVIVGKQNTQIIYKVEGAPFYEYSVRQDSNGMRILWTTGSTWNEGRLFQLPNEDNSDGSVAESYQTESVRDEETAGQHPNCLFNQADLVYCAQDEKNLAIAHGYGPYAFRQGFNATISSNSFNAQIIRGTTSDQTSNGRTIYRNEREEIKE